MAALSELIYRALDSYLGAWFGMKFYELRRVIKKKSKARQDILKYLLAIQRVKDKLRELETVTGGIYIIQSSKSPLETMYAQLARLKAECIDLGIWEILEKTI